MHVCVEGISNASVLPARFGWVEHLVSRKRKRALHLHDMEVWTNYNGHSPRGQNERRRVNTPVYKQNLGGLFFPYRGFS